MQHPSEGADGVGALLVEARLAGGLAGLAKRAVCTGEALVRWLRIGK